MNSTPLVSICCLTYNHKEYLKETIEGFLSQNTGFLVEIIIHDDASTDGTDAILKDYKSKYPDLIIPIFQKENKYSKGIKPFFEYVFPIVRGKYIALCEGDDYWIDPFKLQKQVDFLEANPEYGMICTDYHKYFQSKGKFKLNCFKIKKYRHEVSFDDYVFDRSTIGTATVVFKKSLFLNYLEEIPEPVRKDFNVGDTPFWLYCSIKSKIKVLSDVTAVYRILDNSMSHFTNISNHHVFVKNGLKIPKYFLEKYSSNESLFRKFKRKTLQVDLVYAYKTGDSKFAKEIRQKLKDNGLYGVKDKLLYLGSKSCINKFIADKIFMAVRSLKKISYYG